MRLHLNWKAFGAAIVAVGGVLVLHKVMTPDQATAWGAALTAVAMFLGFDTKETEE